MTRFYTSNEGVNRVSEKGVEERTGGSRRLGTRIPSMETKKCICWFREGRGARESEHSRRGTHARGDSRHLCPILSVLWSGIVKVVKELIFKCSKCARAI